VRRLSFWSAASSSGQEAYSLAMMLLEMGLEGWKLEILGTDLSEKMVEKARSGRYLHIEVNRGLPASHLAKYFVRQGTEWQLKEEVRRLTRFQQFDLRQSMNSFGPFDIVLCRNVLIYFDVETKKKILNQIAGTLPHGGYLLLGAAETTLNLSDAFERRFIDGATFYQKR
jgi:chemotaxis protein methyltransferase CheR